LNWNRKFEKIAPSGKKRRKGGGTCIMAKTKIIASKRKAKASNRRLLHDMVMKRMGRYVGNDEAPPLKTSIVQLKVNNDTET
jgi:hypothetical protein